MNLLLLILLPTVIVATSPWSTLINVELDESWEQFKIKFRKTYIGQDEAVRRQVFENNVKKIQNHNIKYNLGQSKFTMGINEFADLTHEEFKSMYLKYGTIVKTNISRGQADVSLFADIPDTVNWVKKGYVTGVKNQLQCGSCWAFSTTGSMEGQYFRKKRHLVSFSEQQLVDCSNKYGNMGCDGGLMDNAFKYIQRYGIEKEKDYPYTAEDGECAYSRRKVVTKCKGFHDIMSGSENDLANNLATMGPISVGIDASHSSFQFYSGGVYDEENCSSTSLDHGVLAVGYGLDDTTEEKYWLVKNSWGVSWGLKGYIMMSKDKDNQCGIATMASYPIV